MTTPDKLHAKERTDWMTPRWLVEKCRWVLGRFDLDPASSEQANEVVKADRYFTAEQDGLKQDWYGRVFLNPPGRLTVKFWRKLQADWRDCRVDAAVWVGFNLDHLRYLNPSPLNFTTCIPRHRIAFVDPADPDREQRPSAGNYITLVSLDTKLIDAFKAEFNGLGQLSIAEGAWDYDKNGRVPESSRKGPHRGALGPEAEAGVR